ncbi:MAG: hypothetical protein ABIG20_01290 [archaeon]
MSEMIQNAEKSLGFLAQAADFFSGLSITVNWLLAWLANLGLTSMQAYAIIGILALFSLLGLLRFIMLITKILIIVLILWVVLSLVGIL